MPNKDETIKRVFISYRSSEGEFALQVSRALVQGGINIWMDQLEGILPGDDWVMRLQDGIDGAAGMLCMISPTYVESKYCRRELKRADGKGYPIIPVLLKAVAQEDWPLELQEKQYIDFRGWQSTPEFAAKIELLIERIQTLMPNAVIQPQPDQEFTIQENQIVKLHQIEERIASAKAKSEASSNDDGSFKALKKERLKQRLQLVKEQWEAANDQLDTTVNQAEKPVLLRQIALIERDISTIEFEIDQIK